MNYFHAGGIDRPLVITKGTTSIVPHQSWRGQFSRGTYADGANVGKRSDCATSPAGGCTPIQWPGERTTARHELEPAGEIHNWFGGLVDDMRDATGQMYRRNRYYDPQSGQFTQPDPIGLAGGLNEYGFAAGDPVSYSDPYGLFAQSDCPPDCSVTDWGGGGPEQSRGLGHVRKRHVNGRVGSQFVDLDDRSLRRIVSETVENGRMVGAQIVNGEKRFIFERAWGVIGTDGERIARVVINEGGQLVTAFRVRNAFRAAGAGTVSAAAARWTMRVMARAALYATIVGAAVDVALSPTAAGSTNCTGMCQE